MQQLSVSEFSTYRWTFFQDVIKYSRHGYSSIGIWRTKVEDYGLVEAVDLIHEMKLTVSSLNWAGGFTGSDGRSFVDAVEDAMDAIRLASSLQANCLVIHPGARNLHTQGHAHRILEAALQQLIPVAADYDICLAIEPMLTGDASHWSFLESFEQHLEIVNRHPVERLGLVLDLFHVGREASVFQQLPDYFDRIRLVQIADRRQKIGSEDSRCPLGTGIVPLDKWIGRLDQLGYAGPLEIELRGSDMERVDYTDLLRDSLAFLDRSIAKARIMASPSTLDLSHSSLKL
jgi:sugar phosphate isomerase/epimerase